MADAETGARRAPGDVPAPPEKLPDPDVDRSVPPGVEEHQNGRRHRDGDPLEDDQGAHAGFLVASPEGPARGRPHRGRRVAPDVPDRPRGLPAADGLELPPREMSPTARAPQVSDETDRVLVLALARREVRAHERDEARPARAHDAPAALPIR